MSSLKYIINNNLIKGHHFPGAISTTRNVMMNTYVGDRPSSFFKLELDKEKLLKKFLVKPYTYITNNNGKLQEWEERIYTTEIKDIFDYVNKIIIIKEKMDESMRERGSYKTPSSWFTTDVDEEYNMPNFFKWLVTNSPVPIYIQDGSRIYQDDNYIQGIINKPLFKINYGYALFNRGTRIHNDGLYPIDSKNKEILKPIIGLVYNNLYLESKDSILIQAEKLRDNKIGDDYILYICRFRLPNQDELPNDGRVKSAKLDHMRPLF